MRRALLSFAAGLAFTASSAFAQDAAKAFPANYKVVLDNADVTVLRVHYGPHEHIGVHDHSAHPTVYVYLNDSGPVRFQHEEANHFELIRKPTHTGAFRVSPGRLERHSVENLSELPSDYLRIELKRVPLRSFPDEFRGSAPTIPLTPGTTVAYTNSAVRIERVVCARAGSCVLPSEARASVLIAFDPAELTEAGHSRALNLADPVGWLPANTAATVTSSDLGGPYLLRLVLQGRN